MPFSSLRIWSAVADGHVTTGGRFQHGNARTLELLPIVLTSVSKTSSVKVESSLDSTGRLW